MLKTKDIEQLLLDKINASALKDTGYQCESGSRYVELRNICFTVDKPYIFKCLQSYDRVSPRWYEENYTPKIGKQLDNVIDRIADNPLTRQAVILMSDSNGMMTDNVCTMYMHVMLDRNELGSYDMDYIVHMRSSDAVEFGNDIKWHMKIISMIRAALYAREVPVCTCKVIWNADTFHVYDNCFEKILESNDYIN